MHLHIHVSVLVVTRHHTQYFVRFGIEAAVGDVQLLLELCSIDTLLPKNHALVIGLHLSAVKAPPAHTNCLVSGVMCSLAPSQVSLV